MWSINALKFDGTNDYIEVAPSQSLYPPSINQLTIDFWIKLASSGLTMRVVDNTQVTTGGGYFINILDDGKVHIGLNNDPGSYLISNTALEVNQWYHVVASYNGTIIKFFINGLQDPITKLYSNSVNVWPKTLHIGKNHQINSNYLNATLDDLRISYAALY